MHGKKLKLEKMSKIKKAPILFLTKNYLYLFSCLQTLHPHVHYEDVY